MKSRKKVWKNNQFHLKTKFQKKINESDMYWNGKTWQRKPKHKPLFDEHYRLYKKN